jgi:3-hydroxyisobutyrate dehydrogenase-like beta-hydroxyacid dehydrogenase
MMATGFNGLGDMGAPIAHRLLDGGIELVGGSWSVPTRTVDRWSSTTPK